MKPSYEPAEVQAKAIVARAETRLEFPHVWLLLFYDPTKPLGSPFVGGAIIRGSDETIEAAIEAARGEGCCDEDWLAAGFKLPYHYELQVREDEWHCELDREQSDAILARFAKATCHRDSPEAL